MHPHPYIGLCMGMSKPTGFAAWVQCLICQPTPTLHPSWVTCRFQPPVPTLAHTSGCVSCHLSCTSNLKVSYSLSPLPAISHLSCPLATAISSPPSWAGPSMHPLPPCTIEPMLYCIEPAVSSSLHTHPLLPCTILPMPSCPPSPSPSHHCHCNHALLPLPLPSSHCCDHHLIHTLSHPALHCLLCKTNSQKKQHRSCQIEKILKYPYSTHGVSGRGFVDMVMG